MHIKITVKYHFIYKYKNKVTNRETKPRTTKRLGPAFLPIIPIRKDLVLG